MNIEKAREFINYKLKNGLSPTLTYHGFHHTLDVVDAALKIAKAEGITDEESLILLETAALFHDLGFISTYKGHEDEGSRIAQVILPAYSYSEEQIAQICGMIMATKIPQNPQNLLEQIIADADLDYLGRDDFEPIAHSLFLELKEREMVTDLKIWNQIQVKFLENHHYWTKSTVDLRNSEKMKRLEELKAVVATY
jgi:uncharacterized protein